MTFDEVKQYINQIAFSGAIDFEKYKDKTDAQDQIMVTSDLVFIQYLWYLN